MVIRPLRADAGRSAPGCRTWKPSKASSTTCIPLTLTTCRCGPKPQAKRASSRASGPSAKTASGSISTCWIRLSRRNNSLLFLLPKPSATS